ncbi:HET-domain-containing protein [Lentithecium fluviatile CBS 122367]|uniref:HET-domain-containing protein n=1 Tax=Lentithecium fluviatile CBS 122367 TaxID=1168545 RepID=A0A6G1IMW8_9PLEO|nr:HET-domain-containing protein [Lentithecium fluviatile CBS 122367]
MASIDLAEKDTALCNMCRHSIRSRIQNFCLPRLRCSSSERCVLCVLLLKITMCIVPQKYQQTHREFSFEHVRSSDSLYVLTIRGVKDQIPGNIERKFYLFSGSTTAYTIGAHYHLGIAETPPLHGKLSSPSVWRAALDWLKECEERHTCQSTSEHTVLPRRVLDLDGAQGDMDGLKLFESNGHRARYVCLSHCWGPAGCALKTTSHNLDAHKNAIQPEHLPKTFKEAVIFTRWLGVRYLWIDALCIIQDSISDWETESGCMASIYANSYLTLSAVRAADGAGGLFSDVERSANQHEFLHEKDHEKVHIHIRSYIPHSPIDAESNGKKPDGMKPERSADPSFPLLSRAWAFQERILSPRTLHFGTDELYWECRQMTRCECGRKGSVKDWAKGQFVSLLEPPPVKITPDLQLERIQSWQCLVEKYSHHCLTFPSDRLPAFSGLVKKLSDPLSMGRYLAGIWEGDATALVWVVAREPLAPPPASYVAPSWSWAYVNCPVMFCAMSSTDMTFYSIIGSNCIPAGRDSTGSVAVGEIKVKGALELAILTHNVWSFPPSTMLLRWPDSLVRWDTTEAFRSATDLRLLRLATDRVYNHFLILKPVHDGPELGDRYRRLGMISVYLVGGRSRADEQSLAAHSLFKRTEIITLV